MSKVTDKLIDDIIELILDDMDCHHEVDHDEDGVHTSIEYSLNNEAKIRGMIIELIQKPEVTEEWIDNFVEEKTKILITMVANLYPHEASPCVIPKSKAKDFIRSLVEEPKATEEEIKRLATDLSTKWYCSEYGGWSWKTADEIVEEFVLWIYKNGGEIREGSK